MFILPDLYDIHVVWSHFLDMIVFVHTGMQLSLGQCYGIYMQKYALLYKRALSLLLCFHATLLCNYRKSLMTTAH